MLNNNAELDNGVYNENEEKDQTPNTPKKEKDKADAAVDDGLMGLNMQIENKGNPGYEKDNAPSSQIESNATSNLHSLNTSQIVVDTEKAQKLEDLYGYDYDYIIE